MSKQQRISITIGDVKLKGFLETEKAPKSCELFFSLLNLEHHVIHCRWSGESMWIPFPSPSNPLPFENHTSHPVPGQALIYAAGFSEPEMLLPYGACSFSSKVGGLAGNHFLTLDDRVEDLEKLGRAVLWKGAHSVTFQQT
jgi:hypothetical protein